MRGEGPGNERAARADTSAAGQMLGTATAVCCTTPTQLYQICTQDVQERVLRTPARIGQLVAQRGRRQEVGQVGQLDVLGIAQLRLCALRDIAAAALAGAQLAAPARHTAGGARGRAAHGREPWMHRVSNREAAARTTARAGQVRRGASARCAAQPEPRKRLAAAPQTAGGQPPPEVPVDMGVGDELEPEDAGGHGEGEAGQQLGAGVQDDEAGQQQLGGGVQEVEQQQQVLCGVGWGMGVSGWLGGVGVGWGFARAGRAGLMALAAWAIMQAQCLLRRSSKGQRKAAQRRQAGRWAALHTRPLALTPRQRPPAHRSRWPAAKPCA